MELSDGGQILLEWITSPQGADQVKDLDDIYARRNPLVIVVPGLTGEMSALYISSNAVEA